VLLVIAFSGYSFSALYFLPRYLLPTLPFFFVLGAHAVMKRVPSRVRTLAGATVVAGMTWSLLTQPFIGNSEFNLRYLDAVAVHKEMARYIERNHASEVLTGFPHLGELRMPLFGYVDRRLPASPFHLDAPRRDGLILVSTLFGGSMTLEEMSRDEHLQLIKRVQKGAVTAALYGPGEGN
jgi:hypothetical protein